jgi:uncharacterized membrane protein YccC
MQKLSEVEAAKALMIEARDWSVMKWLREKKKVRKAADEANAALDKLNQETKTHWNEELKAAYQQLLAKPGNPGPGQIPAESGTIDPQVRALAKQVKEADDQAHRARMDAEDTFDEAERKLSTRMAREGCRKAIESWELHEKAIRKAEAGIPQGTPN